MSDSRLQDLLLVYRDTRAPETIATLFEETAPRLLQLAVHLTGNVADAEDLVQVTFVTVIDSIEGYRAEKSPMGWLTGILSNRAKCQRRTRARRPDPERLRQVGVDDPAERVVDREAESALRRAIQGLPELYRQVVELVVDQGLGPADVAARLGRAPGAVRTQLHRGIALLRQALPAGLALPVALVAFESTGLAAVKAEVVRHATERAVVKGAAGAGKLMIGALLVLGLGVAALVLGDAVLSGDRGEPPVSASESVFEAATSPGTTDHVVEPATEPRKLERETIAEPSSVEEHGDVRVRRSEFVLPSGSGYSFEQRVVVPAEEGDIRVRHTSLYAVRGQVSLPDLPVRDLDGRSCSSDCYLRAIQRVDPEQLRWSEEVRLDDRRPNVVVHRGPLGWALLAFLNQRLNPDRRRYEWVVRSVCANGPTFSECPEESGIDGLVLDELAFATDPYRDELDRQCAAELAALDRAVAMAAAARPAGGTELVRGVLSRTYANTITSAGWSYTSSTYSFQHDTRDDRALVRNDWGLLFHNPREPTLGVRTVTDDMSTVWNLGPVRAPELDLSRAEAGIKTVVRLGDQLVVRTRDSDTRRWDRLEILDLDPDRWLIFATSQVVDEDAILAMEKSLVRLRPKISGDMVIQVRNGAGGGNPFRACADGSTERVREVVQDPLDLEPPIDMQEGARAYIGGSGVIPFGKVWEVFDVRYRARTQGDSNGPGGFRVVLGDEVIVDVEQSKVPTAGAWSGSIVLRPGDEVACFAEVRNSSQCEVRIFGTIRDAR